MKVVSWNVNGLRAVHNKGVLLPLFAEHQPDVLLLQETKALYEQLPGPVQDVDGYQLRVHGAKRKGYSGVAVYTREEPDEWFEGLGDPEFDDEGRVLGVRFDDVVVFSAYFPNSQAEGKRIQYRLAFGEAMCKFLTKLSKDGLHVVLTGDFNVSHFPIDLARPKPNEKNPGYLPEEREWMTQFLDAGYVDTWRRANPELADVYTWWSYRANARANNVGWRLDYCCVNEALWPRVSNPRIYGDVLGSDHCPVGIDVTIPGR
jgi:exodeoxyribonuclease-3